MIQGRDVAKVVVVGPMGSGKTTLGRALAADLGRVFYDSDEQIAARTGRNGREIAATDGVPVLHRIEREVLEQALEEPGPIVVAAAASVIDDEGIRSRLGDVFCVLVTAPAPVLAERVSNGGHRRRVGADEHLDRRDPWFRAVADVVVDTGATTVAGGVRLVRDAMGAG